MSASFYDLLKYAKTGIAAPEMTHYDKMKALSMCKAGFPVKTISGVPPITFQSDGTALTAWCISGNMVQTGTPTPTVPIQPEECGDKTAQLFDKSDNSLVYEGYNLATAGMFSKGGTGSVLRIPCDASTTYTISGEVTTTLFCISECNTDTIPEENSPVTVSDVIKTSATQTYTLTTHADTKYILIQVGAAAMPEYMQVLMLNTGSTALPYEPFGYKIPISCNGTTSTIYLPEPLRKTGDYADSVSSDGTVTRRIKCIDLGDKTWNKSSRGNFNAYLGDGLVFPNSTVCPAYCDIFKAVSTDNYASTSYSFSNYINNESRIVVNKTGFEDMTADDFKTAMLGHKMWYVLATAQTETFTVPTLTPAKGSNTLSIGTTLAPSEVSITGGIKE